MQPVNHQQEEKPDNLMPTQKVKDLKIQESYRHHSGSKQISFDHEPFGLKKVLEEKEISENQKNLATHLQ